MTIEKIVEYVLHTPHNINRAILVSMLEELVREAPLPGPDSGREIIYDGGIEA